MLHHHNPSIPPTGPTTETARSRRKIERCQKSRRDVFWGSSCYPSLTTTHRKAILFPVKTYTAIVEKCSQTGLYVGYIPGFPGAHSQGETLDELKTNLQEVLAMLLEDGEPSLEGEFVGTQLISA